MTGGGYAWEVSGSPILLESLAAYWRTSPAFDPAASAVPLDLAGDEALRPASAVFGGVARRLGRAIAERGGAFLHASGVEVHGRALLLSGPSGSGKSTGAAVLQALGAVPFADDGAVIATGSSGAVRAAPGPLRPNPFTRGVKRFLTGRIARRAPEGTARILPLAAIAFVRSGGSGALERLGRRDAFLLLARAGGAPETMSLAEAVAANVPVFAFGAHDRDRAAWERLLAAVG